MTVSAANRSTNRNRTGRLRAALSKAKREKWYHWIKSENDERAVLDGCYFDIDAGEYVCRFFAYFLKHQKDTAHTKAGDAFELPKWQKERIILPLFGWKNKEGLRRFRKAYIEIPKKNGKSTLAAGIGLYMLTADGEHGAEVYSTATTLKQAQVVHKTAIDMVDASPDLLEILRINRSSNRISFPDTRSFYEALSAQNSQRLDKEGLNAHCVLKDELHAWNSRKFYETIRYAGAARSQPLDFEITTAGDDDGTLCYERHSQALDVLADIAIDTRFFALIYAASEEDPIENPKTWHKANPSLGITMSVEDFKADLEEAKRTSTLSTIKRYRLNIWSQTEDKWIPRPIWNKAALVYTLDDLLEFPCAAGLDLARINDTCALVFCWKLSDTEYRVWPFFYLPAETAKLENWRITYLEWERDGLIKLTPGETTDYQFIAKDFARMCERFKVQTLLYDPTYADTITLEMEADTGVERQKFAQSWRNFAEPTTDIRRRLQLLEIRHPAHKVLDWQVGNTKIESDSNANPHPVKPQQTDPKKIDGSIALIMAYTGAAQLKDTRSVYDDPTKRPDGLITL